VVELGSYCGRSTAVIAHTLRALGSTATFHAIDPHEPYHMAPPGLDTHATLVATLTERDLDGWVTIVRGRSREVAWQEPVALVFIDALHDEDEVRADAMTWAPRVAPGGLVAFHDYVGHCPGVIVCVDELLAAGWDYVAHSDWLIVLSPPTG
jgi:predicted O-methyltransferase YrrM